MIQPDIIPAEVAQADEAEPAPTITLRFAIGLAVLATALIGAHAVWVASGMPTPDNLSPVMEMLNV